MVIQTVPGFDTARERLALPTLAALGPGGNDSASGHLSDDQWG